MVDFIACQLQGIPGLNIERDEFKIAGWEPVGGSLYNAARLKIGEENVDIIGGIPFSAPTNGSYVSGR